MTKKVNYQEAFEELSQINEELENNEIEIDVLTVKLKRAGELVKICKAQLECIQEETKKILEQFEEIN